MHGIRFARIAQIFGKVLFLRGIFGRSGAVSIICQQIQKACIHEDIALVKALLKTIAMQDIEAYKEIEKALKASLTEEEIKAITE